MTSAVALPTVGPLLREWRQRRRLSQLDLALEAGISARHVSFVETGRSRPSAEVVMRLSEQLEIPLRVRNHLLLAAGYAPAYEQRDFESDEMAPVRDAVQRVLDGHMPYPAVVIDHAWERLAANRAVGVLIRGVAPDLLEPPINVLRLSLHPDGIAPRIINLSQWRTHLLDRLGRQIDLTADPALQSLREEVLAYPSPNETSVSSRCSDSAGHELAVPLRLRTGDGELSFVNTIATFGTAVEITASELSIETFFPLDRRTGDVLHSLF